MTDGVTDIAAGFKFDSKQVTALQTVPSVDLNLMIDIDYKQGVVGDLYLLK